MTKPIEDLELREAVAVEIMGVHVRKQRGARSHLRDLVIPGGVNGIDFVQEEGEPELTVRDLIGGVPAYESSIEAAFAVVEKMREKGWCIDFCGWPGQKWEVQIESDEPESLDIDSGPESFCAADKSLPLAICRAALKAARAK